MDAVMQATALPWWANPDMWTRGIGRKMGVDGRWEYSSLGQGDPPPDVWAVQRLHDEAKIKVSRHQRQQRMSFCTMVHKVYSYYRAAFPAYGKRVWYDMAARKLSMTADAVGQTVIEAEQWGLGTE